MKKEITHVWVDELGGMLTNNPVHLDIIDASQGYTFFGADFAKGEGDTSAELVISPNALFQEEQRNRTAALVERYRAEQKEGSRTDHD